MDLAKSLYIYGFFRINIKIKMQIGNTKNKNKIETTQRVLLNESLLVDSFSKVSGVVISGTVDVTIDGVMIQYPFVDINGNSYSQFEYGQDISNNNSEITIDSTSGTCNLIIDNIIWVVLNPTKVL